MLVPYEYYDSQTIITMKKNILKQEQEQDKNKQEQDNKRTMEGDGETRVETGRSRRHEK